MRVRAPILAAVLVVGVLFSSSATADVHYVDLHCTNPVPPFTDWSTAATSIQEAVNQAVESETVMVTNGTYVLSSQILITNSISLLSVTGPTNTVIDGNQSTRCILTTNAPALVIDGFTITGGRVAGNGGGAFFYDGGTMRNCIISNNVITASPAWGAGVCSATIGTGPPIGIGGRFENCLFSSNWGSGLWIIGGGLCCSPGGFVSNCWFNGNVAYAGGGLNAGETTITCCRITGNLATYDGGGAAITAGILTNCSIVGNSAQGYGGGIETVRGGTIRNCLISNNVAPDAAGLFLGGGRAIDCMIVCNTGTGGSGGIEGWADSYTSSFSVDGCIISNNSGSFGGGGDFSRHSPQYTGTVRSCVFANNYADREGGGFYANDVTVSDCVVRGNRAALRGGGLRNLEGATAFNCAIIDNSSDADGGGAYCGSELYGPGGLRDCVISNNSAGSAGGVYIYHGSVSGCLVVNNDATTNGGGIYNFDGTAENCLVVDNSAVENGGGIYSLGSNVQNNTICSNSAATAGGLYLGGGAARNNILYFSSASTGSNYAPENAAFTNSCAAPLQTNGTGNIDANPMFVDAAAGDYHLLQSSPCIDAGVTNGAPAYDLDGVGRPLDGNADGTNAYDIGAYEFAHPDVDSDSDNLKDTNEVARGTNPAKADTDGDRMNDGDEVFAGTDPLDALSVFIITQAAGDAGAGFVIRWSSVASKEYTLRRAPDLSTDFSGLASNIPATSPENTYTDSVESLNQGFYRVEVEP